MFRVNILKEAQREFQQLDKSVARRISQRVIWLAENLDKIKPEVLSGELSGLYKFRVGAYRLIYEILPNEQLIIIHAVGHRREIYKKR